MRRFVNWLRGFGIVTTSGKFRAFRRKPSGAFHVTSGDKVESLVVVGGSPDNPVVVTYKYEDELK